MFDSGASVAEKDAGVVVGFSLEECALEVGDWVGLLLLRVKSVWLTMLVDRAPGIFNSWASLEIPLLDGAVSLAVVKAGGT
jgi:hypothetical protein